MNRLSRGYVLIILAILVLAMAIGLMVAVPVWHTQVQREKEEELIFRGRQYVEAVRLYQTKFPGRFPESLEALLKENCLRKLYKDPMTRNGEWNLILHREGGAQRGGTVQKILIAPASALSSLTSPQILGVVSASQQKSIRIYYDQDSYDRWLFYYGQDPKAMPDIMVFGEEKKSP
jgi:type II secretory pathway pseudopilin PulG